MATYTPRIKDGSYTQLRDSIYLFASFIYRGREGRRRKEQKKESGSATAAIRLPQLRHVAPLEPVWPLYTSRSPDLGSSLAIHSQSTSGRRRSYYHDCCSGTTVLQASRSWSVPSSSLSCVRHSVLCQYTRAQLALHSARVSE